MSYQAPLKDMRIGETEEIGGAAVWLASDFTDYIVGTTLFIDGGMTLSGFRIGRLTAAPEHRNDPLLLGCGVDAPVSVIRLSADAAAVQPCPA